MRFPPPFSSLLWTNRHIHLAAFPNLLVRQNLGVYHTSEIPLVFGTYNASSIPVASELGPTSNQVALSKYIQSAWVSFARDPKKGLQTDLNWPLYNPTQSTLVRIGGEFNPTAVGFGDAAEFDGDCEAATNMFLVVSGLLPQAKSIDML